ncbi:uncharacterized protein SPPG_09493 [Spizellomyces punctatus DAOM BR117]|uniref:Fat storage-inducing transmembrane protein n=1 Tax=Spizellomyces punctatus (strain DAOM BR117) TaxID=645134 RepID=A0A0L0H7M4_SPIPD|nr:uncharacterized protein SPPG_09493 [Spizellomyces punctatus DAOM BR117]KNC96901.1 hypothetical protein SPPG_09493 [Spizellomyces punctatus DAOM BR117]|eukprot:XP_016604941.1 hypothetical protein SPPG_09493 [Spizellomyces punctatus DAOM BR117]
MKRYQRNLLLFYSLTVLVGSILHTFAPPPPSVFSNKRNPLNVYFAKRGWFWTGVTLLLFALFASPPGYRRRAVIRWTAATSYWVLFAQWAFGHSLFDRVLLVSGTCSIDGHGHPRICVRNGGEWIGFDTSGHCFILIHMSLFIYEELQLLVRPQVVRPRYANATAILSSVLIFLLLLWYTMLIATSVYFHTWQEKIAGTIAGLAFWVVMYGYVWPKWFPDMMPQATAVVAQRRQTE